MKAGGRDAGAAFGVAEYVLPPGASRSSPHRHNGMDEAAHLERGVHLPARRRHAARAGGKLVSIPRGVVHAFLNPGPEPCCGRSRPGCVMKRPPPAMPIVQRGPRSSLYANCTA
ncbi:MAG: cupin domain-containing protein [Chloroflexi bacterium]|nr:cupin domain-containing protein [Chloroflexota bacterium]